MRTTPSSIYRSIQYNIEQGRSNLDGLYLQASTGKKVEVASDDPAAVRAIEMSRSQITMADRYTENIETVQDSMDSCDSYLSTAEDVMQRMKEIATAALNGSLSDADLATYADEVVTLKEQMLDIANAQVNGKYLFAGFRDDQPPFSGDPVIYSGTEDIKYVESGPAEYIQSNLLGSDLFIDPVDVFAEFDSLVTALDTGDTATIQAQMSSIEEASDQLRTQRGVMGNNNARLDDSLSLIADSKLQLQERLSRYEDADLTEVLTEMTQAETALEAALAVSSRISDLSLLNYL
ncbi:MAG: flagellar hook-associated protein FlgL [Desulfuromonas sp.]|nr:flagellar hook-associated protein FlgL [Desulfuromonas sp.]